MSGVILPFVEGQSEVKAIRVLLRRLLDRLDLALQRCSSFQRFELAVRSLL